MALLWMDGFDYYQTINSDASLNLAREYTVNNSLRISSKIGRYNGYSMGFASGKYGTTKIYKAITPTVGTTHLILGFNIYVLIYNREAHINSSWNGATNGISIIVNSLKCANNTVATLSYDTWYHIEARIPITTSGSNKYELYLNGETVFSSSSASFAWNNGLHFGCINSNYSETEFFLLDDCYILDNTGSTNNARLSTLSYVPRIETLFPTSTTASDFTLTGAATAHGALDNVPVNTGQYISSTTAGHKARFGVGDLTNINNIKAVQFNGLASNTTNANNDWKFLMNDTEVGTTSTVTDILTNSTPISRKIFETNPITSAAWTSSNINSIEMGIVNK